jgi:hypothetical protein
MFVKALGSSALARALAAGGGAESASQAAGLEQYLARREKVLLYH